MDLVAGESLAGLTKEVDKETEVEEGFGFAHLPLQHTCVHIVNKASLSVPHLRLLRAGLEQRVRADVPPVPVPRREVDPRVDQAFPSVVLERVVHDVSFSGTLPEVHTLSKAEK